MKLRCPKCKAEIDPKLVLLIIELNKLGLKIKASCSGHDGGYAYLVLDMDAIKSCEVGANSIPSKLLYSNRLTLRWQIPKYPDERIYCMDCTLHFEEVKD